MEMKLEQLLAMSGRLAQQMSDPTVEEWQELLRLRDDAIEELSRQSSVTDEQKRMLFELQRVDGILLMRMEKLKAETAAALHKIGQSKLQKQAYEQAYSAGSFFIDKRK
jgi:hypothetical protein